MWFSDKIVKIEHDNKGNCIEYNYDYLTLTI